MAIELFTDFALTTIYKNLFLGSQLRDDLGDHLPNCVGRDKASLLQGCPVADPLPHLGKEKVCVQNLSDMQEQLISWSWYLSSKTNSCVGQLPTTPDFY